MKKPVALLDLDGTVANFHGAMERDLEAMMSPADLDTMDPDAETISDLEKVPHFKARIDAIKRQPNWWLNLNEIPMGFEIVEALRRHGFRIHVLTRGPKNLPEAWEQKARWVREHLPDADLTITLDKSLTYGRILVDDWPPYIKGWLAHRPNGLVVMPSQPWNQDYWHQQVFRYRGPEDAMMLDEKLAHQFNRKKDDHGQPA